MAKKALISVSNKDGILPLAKKLHQAGYELLSTGGTAKMLQDNNLPVVLVEDYTGFPEMLDGRVKTLQPKVHAGILANRKEDSHMKKMQDLGFDLIDVVVVNLYPFEATIAKEGVSFQEAIENIDIGGIALIRAAAKNHDAVSIICNPDDYTAVNEDLEKNKEIGAELRQKLAVKAFNVSSAYDRAIADYLAKEVL